MSTTTTTTTTTTAESSKVIKGGCHCGFIRYEFDLPIPANPSEPLVGTRCNCSLCQKLTATNITLKAPETQFRLLSPANRDDVPTYSANVKSVRRRFCATCSALCWLEGYYEHAGQRTNLFTVNLATVDQPQEGFDLSEVKVRYYDMLNGNYMGGLKDSPWPNGLA